MSGPNTLRFIVMSLDFGSILASFLLYMLALVTNWQTSLQKGFADPIMTAFVPARLVFPLCSILRGNVRISGIIVEL